MENTIVVSRHGDNLFVTGIAGAHGAVHLVPVLTPADRAVDRVHYLHAEPHGQHGVRVEVRRLRNDAVVRRVTSRRSTARIALR